MNKVIAGILAVMFAVVFQVQAQFVKKENLASGFVVKMVEDEEGTKVVLKLSLVYSSDDANRKLKSVHISNQEKNYLILLSQIEQAQKNNEFININKVNKNIEIVK